MFGGVNETVADWQHLKAFFERHSKLFADLPTHRLYRRFTFFDTAAGQGPLTLAVTMWANKEDLALFVQHHSTHLTAQPHSVTFDIGCHASEVDDPTQTTGKSGGSGKRKTVVWGKRAYDRENIG